MVAIIGVLASIAVPQYQNYTARAQASEGLSVTAGLRADIAEQYSLTGSMPTEINVEGINGRYVDGVSYDEPVISVSFGSASSLNGQDDMTIQPRNGNPAEGWVCGGLEPRLLPAGCRGEANTPADPE